MAKEGEEGNEKRGECKGQKESASPSSVILSEGEESGCLTGDIAESQSKDLVF